MKLTKYLISFSLAAAGIATFTSCEDMLDKGNSYVIYADTEHLTSSSDTVTSVVGILNKLQAIAVRTNLIGEVRADLVTMKENATLDLKSLANFEADVTSDADKNQYNNPRDYYAVINNCNYFLDRVNDSLPEIHTDAMKYMFERETAAVHCIRAWAYLQCVLAYGKIPFVDKPVLTEAESKKEHPMYGIADICEYFIEDLKPYVNVELPDYNSFDNSNVTPKMCFFPANILIGDFYLWLAAINHDPEAAKESAKAYYDFIVWDQSGKTRTTTGSSRAQWNANDLYEQKPLTGARGSFSFSTTGKWGGANQEGISAIAMDSSSAKGYYNELRNIYNATQRPDIKEASLEPSEALKTLSQSQVYVGYDRQHNDTIEVLETMLEDEAIEHFMMGDLRFASVYSTTDREYNEKLLKMQSIQKHNQMNVLIYRVQQIYLRLAEALNYAGYPRFAKQILTMGLSNTVIEHEVQPYYNAPEDSAFFAYFDFNDTFFKPEASSYTSVQDQYGNNLYYKPSLTEETINMLGIHSRGSGYSFMNEKYLPAIPLDSNYYELPTKELEAIGDEPIRKEYEAQFPTKPTLTAKKVDEPSSWQEYGTTVVTFEQYWQLPAIASQKESRAQTLYKRYIDNDSIGLYVKYLDAVDVFNKEMEAYSADTAAIMTEYRTVLAAYNERVDIYKEAWQKWHTEVYSNPEFVLAEQNQIDQAILDEQALELAYEGNRFFDLMRRALWHGDNSRLSDPIKAARPELNVDLNNKKNWFLHYKGQIGY